MKCSSCKYFVNDQLEGGLCVKHKDSKVLSSGKSIDWYGMSSKKAFLNFCKGQDYKFNLIPFAAFSFIFSLGLVFVFMPLWR